MYSINPPAVYAHESVMKNPKYRAGVERVVAALEKPREIVTFTDDDYERLILEEGLLDRVVPMGTLDEVYDPILMFNTFRFAPEERRVAEERLEDLRSRLGSRPGLGGKLFGLHPFIWTGYNQPGDPRGHDKVCRPCWRIHLQTGCLHRCAYCGLGGLLLSMVNVDEYSGELRKIIDAHEWQKTYLLDDDADPPGLEPELGALGELIEYFGTLKDRYLIIHTKTWNTRWLESLKHNGNTIIVWSISGDTQSRLIEPKAGTTEERIEAAKIAQEAGYQIRYKFKPIIPVRSWKEDAAEAVALLFEKTDPDMISLCAFMWMDIDELKTRLAPVLELLDPTFVRAAEEARVRMESTHAKPFPSEIREQIYDHYFTEIRKHSDIPVSLSTENFPMWKRFESRLGMTATNYVCGCGPQCTPGLKKLTRNAFEVERKSVV